MRNCNLCVSVMGKFLRSPRSKYQTPGLRKPLRDWTPKVPAAGATQTGSCPAAQPRVCPLANFTHGLNQAADSVKPVFRVLGFPTRFQNCEPLPAPTPAKSSLVRIENRPPD